MNMRHAPWLALGFTLLLMVAGLPLIASGYVLAVAISMLSFTALAAAWSLFSGPTHYISLATVAFFGIGAYTAAIGGELMPWPLVLVVAGLVGVAVALVVGLSTLRLSGIYFVIFTFGLTELVRQLVTWYEVNIKGTVGRYLFLDIPQAVIYWQLAVLTGAVLLIAWLISRSRLGLAARVIGEDETVARHAGIDTTWAKITLFAISAAFMSVTGAVMAPRWTYVDPAIAFNPMISFQVVIMALLGGTGSLWGPVLGVVPLVLLFEFLTANFPNAFNILLGAVFMTIVYFLPRGVVGLVQDWWPQPVRMPAVTAPRIVDDAVLAVNGLGKSFGGLVAVHDLSFRVEAGQIVGLIGPNGSGKTTVLNMISGALKPDTGSIHLCGRRIDGLLPDRVATLGIARTFQLVRVLGSMTCRQNVEPAIAFRARPSSGNALDETADTLLARVGLAAAKVHMPASQLTYIDQKRVELARALALEPKLLLLDEWLAGLNPTELEEGINLIDSMRREGLSIIMVEHVMDAVRSLCDHCIVMNAGRLIAAGQTTAALADPEVVRAYLGGPDA